VYKDPNATTATVSATSPETAHNPRKRPATLAAQKAISPGTVLELVMLLPKSDRLALVLLN
jgi:hypothetical protein